MIWLLFGFAAMLIANSKSRSGCGWFILGLLLGPFALVVAALPTAQDDAPLNKTHARCPDCRELVLIDARKCKHCGCALIPLSEQ